VPSIINGLFSGRSGIASHGSAIAVVGDNISNASTVGFKAARAEFEDLIAGGQASGQVTGAGSSVSSITSIFQQGTLEFTSRPLDLAIDGNGFFAVADGAQRFYTRAGNFKVDASGYIVNQNGLAVLGLPAGGTGALQPININTVSQDSVATTAAAVSGNLDASAPILAGGAAGIPAVPAPGSASVATTYTDLNNAAEFSTVVQVFDSLGAKHTMTMFFFHTAPNTYIARAYVNSEECEASGAPVGYPRQVGTKTMTFNGDGSRSNAPTAATSDFTATVAWNNGSTAAGVDVSLTPFTQFSAASNILSITQDGQGIGTVTSLAIDQDGQISALLDNGQQATIGIIGLVNFSNPEGLTRVGNQLLSQSTASGEPVVGTPKSGTLGSIAAGSLELSTVDIASEFVKLITLQRGFQANSRIITTINQLLNDIIQLA
jgi:flagellar hook protein FlgE